MDIKTIKEKYSELSRLAWENKLDTQNQKEIVKTFNEVSDKDKIFLIDLVKDFKVREVVLLLPEIYRLEKIDKERSGIYLNFYATVIMNHPDFINKAKLLFRQEQAHWDFITRFIKSRDEGFYNKYLKDIT